MDMEIEKVDYFITDKEEKKDEVKKKHEVIMKKFLNKREIFKGLMQDDSEAT